MPEYIERQAAINKIRYREKTYGCVENTYSNVIKNLPAADVAPVVHAYWIKTANTWTHDLNEASKPVYRCSKCGRIEKAQEPFCNCGAKMDMDGEPHDP